MLRIEPPRYQFCPFCGKKLDIKIEEGKERKFCSSCKWTYYPRVATAVAGVIVKKDKILLVKRNREPFKGSWMFPAGFVDFGEHPKEALVREIKEETGLRVMKSEFIDIFQAQDDYRNPGHFVFFYKVKVTGSKITTDKEENQDIAWFSIKNPPEISWKSHRYVMKLLKKNLI